MYRRANLLPFPQERPDLGVETAAERTVVFVPQAPLEQEMVLLLGGRSIVASGGQVLMEVERRSRPFRSTRSSSVRTVRRLHLGYVTANPGRRPPPAPDGESGLRPVPREVSRAARSIC